jgi:hypothetical protein
MADQRYIIPTPLRPWYQRISADRWFSLAAILASAVAAAFTGWYAWDTHGMRVDAQKAANRQEADVRVARDAAVRSADAAILLADGMKKSAEAAQTSAELAKQSVQAFRDLSVTQRNQLIASERNFRLDQRPRIDFEVTLSGEKNITLAKPILVTIFVRNRGKTPALGSQAKTYARFAEELIRDYPPEATYPAIVDLSSTSDSFLKVEWQVTALQPTNAARGRLRLYVYGVVTFRDAIGSIDTYSEDFCAFYPVQPDGIVQDFVHGCSEGNPNKIKKQ